MFLQWYSVIRCCLQSDFVLIQYVPLTVKTKTDETYLLCKHLETIRQTWHHLELSNPYFDNNLILGMNARNIWDAAMRSHAMLSSENSARVCWGTVVNICIYRSLRRFERKHRHPSNTKWQMLMCYTRRCRMGIVHQGCGQRDLEMCVIVIFKAGEIS